MGADDLFGDLPESVARGAAAELGGKPRLREPVRDQIELRAVDIDSLIGNDHPVRIIWAYVMRLDLNVLEDRIKSREARPGHPATLAAAVAGAVALRHQRRGRQRAGVGTAMRPSRCLSLAVWRRVGELSHAGGLPGRLRRPSRPFAGRASGGAGAGRPGRSWHLGAGRRADQGECRRGLVPAQGDAGPASSGRAGQGRAAQDRGRYRLRCEQPAHPGCQGAGGHSSATNA